MVEKSPEEKLEEFSGRVQESAGDLTGDEKLQREGKIEQVSSDIKGRVTSLVDTAKEKARSLRGRR